MSLLRVSTVFVVCVFVLLYVCLSCSKTLLNLSGYVVGEKPKVGYRLYAVSNHFGTQSGGHCKYAFAILLLKFLFWLLFQILPVA